MLTDAEVDTAYILERNIALAAEVRRLRTRLANVERDLRQHREMRAAEDVVRVPLLRFPGSAA